MLQPVWNKWKRRENKQIFSFIVWFVGKGGRKSQNQLLSLVNFPLHFLDIFLHDDFPFPQNQTEPSATNFEIQNQVKKCLSIVYIQAVPI